MCLRPLKCFKFFQCGNRQNLTSKDGPRAERLVIKLGHYPVNTKYVYLYNVQLYNVGTTSKTWGRLCTNVIQMLPISWVIHSFFIAIRSDYACSTNLIKFTAVLYLVTLYDLHIDPSMCALELKAIPANTLTQCRFHIDPWSATSVQH